MKQQPDQLFRSKLRNYSKSVPDSAWARIDAGLEKKPYPFYKLAIAASLLLASVCIYIFWPSSLPHQNTTIAHQSEAKPNEVIEENAPGKNESAKKEEIKNLDTQTTDKDQLQKPVKSKNRKPALVELKVPTLVHEQKNIGNNLENNIEEELIIAENIAGAKVDSSATEENESKNLFIVYTAEDTREYLSKRIPEEATTEEETASTFKKVLRKARNLKSNQDPFGDLRQMKNEILALNFKSDKERGQKK
jgi:hypothetical protein